MHKWYLVSGARPNSITVAGDGCQVRNHTFLVMAARSNERFSDTSQIATRTVFWNVLVSIEAQCYRLREKVTATCRAIDPRFEHFDRADRADLAAC